LRFVLAKPIKLKNIMAEKHTGRGRKSTSSTNAGGSRQHHDEGFSMSAAKMEKLYDVLEALIDTLDMPRNRGRALKYGIRAIGEFITPENDTSGARARNNGSSSSSLADDEQESSSGSTRRG
jgi:hypothetical protein